MAKIRTGCWSALANDLVRRRGGKLTEDDREVWSKVAKTAVPLNDAVFIEDVADEPQHRPPPRPIKPLTRIGGVRPEPKVTIHQNCETTAAPQMDRKNYDRLRRGKLRPEGRLDLHGLNAAEAQTELTHFLLHSHGTGKRLVLVITGKGKSTPDDGIMPVRQGVLRHSLPNWLTIPVLRPIVLDAVPAHAKHGGGGAFYIYLRRKR